jgi:hypothetical protein
MSRPPRPEPWCERDARRTDPGVEDERARRDVEEPSERLAVREEPGMREDPVPVVDVSAHERQGLRARVAQIGRDVHQTLAEPEHAHVRREGFAARAEMEGGRGREEELAERAAEEVGRLAEDREEEMAGLVEGEVHAVEEVVRVAEDEPEGVRREGRGERALPEHALLIGRPAPRL